MQANASNARRVVYLHSLALERAADALPANLGRSSMVHGLIRSLELVDSGNGREEDSETAATTEEHDAIASTGKQQQNGDRVYAESCDDDGHRKEDGTHHKAGATLSPLAPLPLARVVPPDPDLGTAAEMRRHHDARYVDYILGGHENNTTGVTDNDGSDSDSGSDSDADLDWRGWTGTATRRTAVPARKRRKITEMGLEHDCPTFPALSSYARLVAAATMTACRLLARDEADIAIAWDGGRHHAMRARASGFCYVADVVLGILLLQREGVATEARSERAPGIGLQVGSGENEDGGESDEDEERTSCDPEARDERGQDVSDNNETATTSATATEGKCTRIPSIPNGMPPPPPATPAPIPRRPRIMYLDLDLHYGDGVCAAFQSPTHFSYPLRGRPRPPQVLTFSIHHASRGFFPAGAPGLTPRDTAHPFSLSLPLGAYANSASYARAWASVEKIRQAWAPDYVVLQLGVDALPADPVGQVGAWGVSGPGSVPWVVERVREWGVKTAVLGGGGYAHANAARAWALATAGILGRSDVAPSTDVPESAVLWEEYAPSFTLDVPESNIPDETTGEMMDEADETFEVLAARIREILRVHG